MSYIAIKNNIVAKKTTELVFLWLNMGQLCFKVLSLTIRFCNYSCFFYMQINLKLELFQLEALLIEKIDTVIKSYNINLNTFRKL